MVRTRQTWMIAALAVLLGSCNADKTNPFTGLQETLPPPADAALIFTSDAWSTQPGAGREIFAVDLAGASLTRLTACNNGSACDLVEAAPAPQHERVMARRTGDSNGDGKVDSADGQGLVFFDLARSVQSEVVPASAYAQSVDWSAVSDLVAYSGRGPDGLEDVFAMQANGSANRNVTASAGVRERHTRIDPSGQTAVIERLGSDGLSVISLMGATTTLTSGGTRGEPLPGTPYVVGADADPAWAPDGSAVVFRRLTAIGNGQGYWDILTVSATGTSPGPVSALVTGPAWRGAPDWGKDGITFSETDTVTGQVRLVVVDPTGGNRRTPVTLGAGYRISNPRWLR